jgi:hypothetical protein
MTGILIGKRFDVVPMVETDDVVDVALRWLVSQDWAAIETLAVSGPRPVLL